MDRATLRGLEAQVEAGDESALAILWQSSELKYRGSIAARVNGKEDRDDLQQEAFINTLKAVRARRFKRKRGSLSGWTGTIANNVAVDFCRRESRKAKVIAEFAKGNAPIRHERFLSAETLDESVVHHVLSKMKEDDVDLLRLIYVAQMSLSNVAEIRNIPLGTVKSRLFRIKGQFLCLLTQKVGEEKMEDLGLLRKAS